MSTERRITMIAEDYVSFETAKLLKEKGFDEYCGYYDKTGEYWCYNTFNHNGDEYISAPTLQMAMKWLREVHNIYISISHRFSHNADNDVLFSWYINTDLAADGEYVTYEEACEAGIKYCLENLI